MSGTESSLSESGNNQSLNVTVAAGHGIESVELIMGEKSKKRDVTGKTKKKKPNREAAPLKEGLTTVAHFCILAFVLLILYLCFKQPFTFFTWHPLLLSVGWMLLMSQAILAVSKENVIMQKFDVSHSSRITVHWVFFAVAAVLIAAGFLVITINKNRLDKFHYTSWHGLLGLLAVIAYILPCFNGVLLYYSKDLRDYMNPKIVKLAHYLSGVLCFACGGLSLMLSVYTKWFQRSTDSNLYIFLFGLVTAIFPVVWIIQRPLIKCAKNIYKMFSRDD